MVSPKQKISVKNIKFEILKFENRPKIDRERKIMKCNNLSDIKLRAAIYGILLAEMILK